MPVTVIMPFLPFWTQTYVWVAGRTVYRPWMGAPGRIAPGARRYGSRRVAATRTRGRVSPLPHALLGSSGPNRSRWPRLEADVRHRLARGGARVRDVDAGGRHSWRRVERFAPSTSGRDRRPGQPGPRNTPATLPKAVRARADARDLGGRARVCTCRPGSKRRRLVRHLPRGSSDRARRRETRGPPRRAYVRTGSQWPVAAFSYGGEVRAC